MVAWRELERQVDQIVDGRFGDPVLMIPWVKEAKVFLVGEDGPDPARNPQLTTGIIVTPGAHLVGEGGRATGGSGGGFNTRVLEAEVWLSVTLDNIGGDYAQWQPGDRVFMPNTMEMFEISYIEPSATFRPNIHLIREHDVQLGIGGPLGNIVPAGANGLYFDFDQFKFYRAATETSMSWVQL
jgi:hypothetical protein